MKCKKRNLRKPSNVKPLRTDLSLMHARIHKTHTRTASSKLETEFRCVSPLLVSHGDHRRAHVRTFIRIFLRTSLAKTSTLLTNHASSCWIYTIWSTGPWGGTWRVIWSEKKPHTDRSFVVQQCCGYYSLYLVVVRTQHAFVHTRAPAGRSLSYSTDTPLGRRRSYQSAERRSNSR